jgi:GH15 family glucan-1,4-alpha-glucosidase
LRDVPVHRYEQHRDAIRALVDERGYDVQRGTYVAELDGRDVDASLLLLCRFGYRAADDPRVRATVNRILHELAAGESLLYRFRPEIVGGEGAFALCSFWAVDCLLRDGRIDDACRWFERMVARANDVGLFGEELDPSTGQRSATSLRRTRTSGSSMPRCR